MQRFFWKYIDTAPYYSYPFYKKGTENP